MVKLSSETWVFAYLRRLDLATISAYVLKRGDAKAGAILIKLNSLDGKAELFERYFDMLADKRSWMSRQSGLEAEIDAAIAQESARDPDLWIIEVESAQGRHLLDEPGLS